MSIQGTYRNTVCVFVFLVSLSLAHSRCRIYSLSLLTLLLIVVLFVHVDIRHSSSLVTRRRSSLVVARHSLSLVVNLPSHSLSHSRTHLHSLSTLSLLLIVIVAHGIFVHCPLSPSISSLVSFHFTLFHIAVPYSRILPYVVYYYLLNISHSTYCTHTEYCSVDSSTEKQIATYVATVVVVSRVVIIPGLY